jgi:RHS repeat-associated protein
VATNLHGHGFGYAGTSQVPHTGSAKVVEYQARPGTGWVQITGTEQSHQEQEWVPECELYDESGYCIQWGGHWEYTTYWDRGSVSVTVNGLTKSTTYGQSSTAAAIATALGSAINADSGYPVTAAVNGATITLTAKTSGAATNYTLTVASSSNLPQYFSSPSFIPVRSGPTLTGGSDYSPGNPGSGPLLLSTPAVTSYTYDTLDNLTQVVQSGSRPRTFTYNSLSQLLTATNPESGTISYTYDADGNLLTKTDARSIVVTYAYDALHRATGKTYSNGDPAASFIYDVSSVDGLSIQYPVGRLVKSAQGSTRTVNSFDISGRILTQWQCTPLNCGSGWFALTYTYNSIGGIASYTDGVGHTYTQSFNTAAQVTQVTSSLNDAQHPGTLASGLVYNPAGALEYMLFGNGLYQRLDMNNRLQPCRMRVTTATTSGVLCSATDPTGDLSQMKYGFNHSTANNGNVMTWSGTGAQSFSRTYTYDELNRLKTMAWSVCNYTWSYDIWANRTAQDATGGTGPCGEHFPIINTKNQIVDTGYQYDLAGNMTAEPGKTYQYDAENRMVSINNGCPSTLCYTYDANGRRVRKIASGTTTEYIYGAGGVVAEKVGTTWTVGYVYLNGQLLAQYKNGTTRFAHKDHLGSTRLLTKPDGTYDAADVYDYLPFGESVGSSGTTTTHKFTGKERDTESGLDNFGARYFGSTLGRFMSADPLGGHMEDPQTLNRYTYVRNNPLNLTDPTGLDFTLTCEKEGDTCHNGQVGKYSTDDDGNKTFTATLISNDKNGNLVDQYGNQYSAAVSQEGVYFSQQGGDSAALGIFLNGTSPTTIQGSGAFEGFTFNFTYSRLGSGVTAGGSFSFDGRVSDTYSALQAAGYTNFVQDTFNILHPSSNSFRAVDFRSNGDPGTGARASHFTVFHPTMGDRFKLAYNGGPPTRGHMHFGEHNPYKGGFIKHTLEVIRSLLGGSK